MMAGLGIADEEFVRGKVPMTKEEIRVLTLTKARILSTDIVWDVGAGTGSMSVEAALLASKGHVYAVERNPEGVSLIEKNKEKAMSAAIKDTITSVLGSSLTTIAGFLALCTMQLIYAIILTNSIFF